MAPSPIDPPNPVRSGSIPLDAIRQISQGLVQEQLKQVLEFAVERKLISAGQAEECLKDGAGASGGLPGEILVVKGWINDKQFQQLQADLEREKVAAAAAIPPPPADPVLLKPVAAPLGRYEVHDKIGEGPAGEVHRARDHKQNADVVLKMLKESPAGREGGRTRFLADARAGAGFEHPGVVRVLDSGETWGRPFISMEFVEGPSLQARILKHDAERDLVEMLEKAARVVATGHDKGVMHLDLKPANILGGARVGDYGLVRLLGLTGTPAYRAPEQAPGREKAIGPWTDVYALGVILREILADRRDGLGLVAAKATEPAPPARYLDAGAFADELRRHLDGQPLLTAAPPPAMQLHRWVKANRALVAVAAGVFLAMSAWSVGAMAASASRTRALVAKGEELFAKGMLVDARDAYLAALDESPRSGAARAGLGRIEGELKRRDDAQRDKGDRALKAAEGLRRLEETRPFLEEAVSCLYRVDADAALLASRAESARARINDVLKAYPDLAQAWYFLGRTWDLQGEDARAREAWLKAVELDPGYSSAHGALGRQRMLQAVLAGMTDRDSPLPPMFVRDALDHLGRAIRQSRFDDDLQRKIASILVDYLEGQAEPALWRLSTAIDEQKASPGLADLHWLRGVLAATDAERIKPYGDALALRPNDAVVLFSRGAAQQALGHLDAALKDYAQALAIRPRLAPALSNRSALYKLKRDYRKAVDDATRATEIEPGLVAAWVNRGAARQGLNELDGALADYGVAIEKSAPGAGPYHLRAAIYEARGEHQKAIDECTLAIRFRPRALAHAVRGEALLNLGKAAEAVTDLEEAVRIAPPGWSNLDRVKRTLEDARRRLK